MDQYLRLLAIISLILPTLSWGEEIRVLHVGDSHTVGTFGRTLIKLNQQENTFDLSLNGSCGSSPRWWLKGTHSTCGTIAYRSPDLGAKILPSGPTPIFKDLLKEQLPQIIIVELGSNLMPDLMVLPQDAPIEQQSFAKDTLAFIETIQNTGVPCIWVGPPQGRNKPTDQLQRLYTFLEQAVANTCLFIDSRPFTPYPATGGDGAHFDSLGEKGRELASNWANVVWDKLTEIAKTIP